MPRFKEIFPYLFFNLFYCFIDIWIFTSLYLKSTCVFWVGIQFYHGYIQSTSFQRHLQVSEIFPIALWCHIYHVSSSHICWACLWVLHPLPLIYWPSFCGNHIVLYYSDFLKYTPRDTAFSLFFDMFSTVQLLSHVQLFATPWTAARQASLSIINSRRPPKPMSIGPVIPSSYLILCHPFHLLPSIFPSIRVISNESALPIRWPKYWSFSFNISPSNEYSGLISKVAPH